MYGFPVTTEKYGDSWCGNSARTVLVGSEERSWAEDDSPSCST